MDITMGTKVTMKWALYSSAGFFTNLKAVIINDRAVIIAATTRDLGNAKILAVDKKAKLDDFVEAVAAAMESPARDPNADVFADFEPVLIPVREVDEAFLDRGNPYELQP